MQVNSVLTSIVMRRNGSISYEPGLSEIIWFSPGELSGSQMDALREAFPGVFQFTSDGAGRSWAQVNPFKVQEVIESA